MSNHRQLCTMHVGEHLLGIEVVSIQEVIGYQQTTEVPMAPWEVRGLINLRGQILTAVDLRRRLGVAEVVTEDGDEKLPMNVVVETTMGAVSLLVDSIGDVVEVDDSMCESTPPTVDDCTRELVCAVYKFDGSLLLELDVERAVHLVPETASA